MTSQQKPLHREKARLGSTLTLQIKSPVVDSEDSRVDPNHNQGKSAKLILLNINRKVSSSRKYSIFGFGGSSRNMQHQPEDDHPQYCDNTFPRQTLLLIKTINQCTMQLSPCKGVNQRFEPNFYHRPHFPAVSLFQTEIFGDCQLGSFTFE